MKKTRLLYMLLAWFLVAGCEDDDNDYAVKTVFDVSDLEVVIDASGKTTDNTIVTSTVPWTIAGMNDWCRVSPESGEAGTTLVYFELSDNEDYDDRNVLLTLNVGEQKALINVIQKKKDALTASSDKFSFEQPGGELSIRVKSNIDYIVNIPEASASWITPKASVPSKGIETTDLLFTVAENQDGEKREGQVIIEDELRRFSDTIRVYQVQKDMIVLTANEYRVPMEGMKLDVQLKANIDYEVLIPQDDQKWVHVLNTRSMRTDVVKFTIDPASDDEENRSAVIVFKDRNSNLQESVTILQVPKESITVTPEIVREVPQAGGSAEFDVQANVGYEVIIPERVDWLSVQPEARAMQHHRLVLKVEANPEGEIERTARVIVKGTGEDEVTDTVYVHQLGRPRIDEVQALYALQQAFDGKWDWDMNKPVSQWKYITTNSEGKVTAIKLSVNNLAGQLPPEIGDLEFLESLTINSSKTITGPIPAEIGNLKNLKVLSLAGSYDYIPEELWKLEKLEELTLKTLATNSPACIGALTNLKKLALECIYEGPLPPEFGNLKKLTSLTLGSATDATRCGFTKLSPEIGQMESLEKLNIYGGFEGPVPAEIGQLKKLTSLQIEKTGLTSIPDEIGNLKLLKTAYLKSNKFQAIPAGIGGLESLTTLQLNDNALKGAIPAEIGNLTKLTYLQLYNNQLTGEIPASIGNLKAVTGLYLQNNQLSGSIPYEIGNMSALSTLRIYNNKLTGSIPASVFGCPKLGELDLSNNQLTGSIPGEIGDAKAKLKTLNLQNNKLSGTLPQALCDMNLSTLNLENNNITGSIPENLYREGGTNFVTSSSKLILNGNRLTGEIPKAILVELTKADRQGRWLILDQQEGYGFTNRP